MAIKACTAINKPLVIKATIDPGRGKQVNTFTIKDGVTNYRNLKVLQLFKLYKKDFTIQEFVGPSTALKDLNPSSLNTIRVLTMAMYPISHYVKFVSWDISIDKTDAPVFIEFNTYNQNINIHQITNGPLLGKITNDNLEVGLKTY